jgi:hypothetical protein
VGADLAGNLARPALAVKIDNAPEAIPQAGLNKADLVAEIQVEGISRMMAVFHSTDADPVGPVRSARHSDPDILGMFGKPLFGWSGANDGVVADVSRTPWVVNVNWDSVKQSDYVRRSVHRAPHNLYTKTATLFGYTKEGQPAPTPVFEYLAAGAVNTAAVPLAGASLSVGGTPSQWVWDGAGSWLRWEYGRRHATEDGGQVSAANVVVVETRYTGKDTTAVSIGAGRAFVLTGGTVVEGTWSRASASDPYKLTGADGQPLRLTPGRTWLELTEGSTIAVMSGEKALGLMSAA